MRESIEKQIWSEAVWGLWPRYQPFLVWTHRSRYRIAARRVLMSVIRGHALMRYYRAVSRTA